MQTQTQEEQEAFINTPPEDPFTNPVTAKKLYQIRRASFVVVASCILRTVMTIIFSYSIIDMILGIALSLLGLVAAFRKKTCLLIAYGVISVIEVGVAFGFITYFFVSGNLHIHSSWRFFLIIFNLSIYLAGGILAIEMRKMIKKYEAAHGAMPRCLARRCCNYSCQNQTPAQQPVATPTTQETTSNTDFVMIPMTSFDSSPQTPTPQIQQSPQPSHPPQNVVFNQQPIMFAQPNAQFGNQPYPFIYAIPQPNAQFGHSPIVQFVPQPVVVPQPVANQSNLPQYPNYVYRN